MGSENLWRIHKTLAASVVGLLLLGALTVDSAAMLLYLRFPSEKYLFFAKHVFFILLGITSGYVLLSIRRKFYLESWFVVTANLIIFPLLLAVFLFPARNGAHRWVQIAGFTFQPSEFAKIVMLLTLSLLLSPENRHRRTAFFYLGIVVFLVLLEPDVGTALFLMFLGLGVMLMARVEFKVLLKWAAVFLVLGLALLFITGKGGHVKNRLKSFFSAQRDYSSQAGQALVALGSGGLTGSSPGESLEKFYYLPEAHSDYIFSILGEEWGFVGTSSVIFLFMVFLFSGFSIASSVNNPQASLLAYGLALSVVLQALVNITINVGLFPSKGLPLPFMSYGGSAMLSALLQAALLMHIWMWRRENET